MNGIGDIATVASTSEEAKKSLSLLILLNQTFSNEQKLLVLHKLNSSMFLFLY